MPSDAVLTGVCPDWNPETWGDLYDTMLDPTWGLGIGDLAKSKFSQRSCQSAKTRRRRRHHGEQTTIFERLER